MQGYWNLYYCGLCKVEFAISQSTDKGDTSCPKCESGEDTYLEEKINVCENKESKRK